jgi:hypothetical protein
MDLDHDVKSDARDERSRQLKRRGILAAVAALVAGVAGKASTRSAEARHGATPPGAGANLDTNALHVDQFNSATGSTTLQRDGGVGNFPTLYVVNNAAGPGTRSDSNNTHGIIGFSSSGSPGANTGVFGFANVGPGVTGSGGVSSVGVFGTSPNAGIYGTSFNRGIWGNTQAGSGQSFYADGAGIGYYATVQGDAVFAETLNPARFAGNFRGNVFITGSLSVQGTKSAVVPDGQGSYRRVYCEESTESYFSDYGEVRYRNGHAEVRLDPDFASLVHNAGYHIFLTEYGDNNALYVSNRTPTGFEVQAKDSPTASGTFIYRLVGKRKDVPSPRLSPVQIPAPMRPDPVTRPVPPITPPDPPARPGR